MRAADRRKSKLYNLEQVLKENKYDKRKTKIICTIGPSCWSVENLVKLIDAGMNVARLNFSHGDHQSHHEVLKRIWEAQLIRKESPIGIMLDTKGPEIRTGMLIEGKKAINLKAGQKLEITQDYTFKGDENKIACSYKSLNKSVKVGNNILIADGTLVCTVLQLLDDGIIVEVQNDCSIGEKKNMNLPGCKVDLPTVTEQDENDIVNFAVKYQLDYIALSFTRKAEDIEKVRDLLGPKRQFATKIIAKIENQEGMANYDEILDETDGIMVARGDLGMEIPPQKVFMAQKWMVLKANQVGKPIVVATQMLESMIQNPRPTRAEASDVANAVLDGADAVMLSGETANGQFPFECVEIMSSICQEAEDCFDNVDLFYQNTQRLVENDKQYSEIESLASSAVQMSFEIQAPLIVIFTVSGNSALQVARLRPKAYIIAVSFEESTIKTLTYARGVRALRVPSFQGMNNLVNYAINAAKMVGACKSGDKIVCIMGLTEENVHDMLTTKIVP